MKISDIELFLPQVQRTDHGPPVCTLMVCLSTDTGVQGWGEAVLPWRTEELAARRDLLLSALVGRSVSEIEELLQLDVVDSSALACSLEMASWDLMGRATGYPLCHLWGGTYRRRIPLAVRVEATPAAATAPWPRDLAEHGIHSLIVALTGEPRTDADAVDTLLEAASGRADLWLDGGGRFTEQAARQLASLLDERPVQCWIDPLQDDRLESLAALARELEVPLALSRGINHPRDVFRAARAGAGQAVVICPQRVGGLTAAQRCANVADAAAMSASLRCDETLGVGAAAMLHLAAASPCFAAGNECGYHQMRDDVLVEPLEMIDGLMSVPQGPGLGVEVDRTKLERYHAA